MSKRLRMLVVVSTLSLWAVPASAQEQVSDSSGFVSIRIPASWQAWPTEEAGAAIYALPNNNLFTPGLDLSRPGLVAVKPRGVKDLLPTIQIARLDIGYLGIDGETRSQLERTLEKRYSEAMGTRFRLFTVAEETVNGVRAFRVTGVYAWRTNNIRMVQYLIPGAYHLYAATYVAQEREFQRHLSEAEQILASISIGDAPVDLGWVGGLLRWLALVLGAGAVIWGIAFANSLRPESRGPAAPRGSKFTRDGGGSFERRR
jgi:hypothetical protein